MFTSHPEKPNKITENNEFEEILSADRFRSACSSHFIENEHRNDENRIILETHTQKERKRE